MRHPCTRHGEGRFVAPPEAQHRRWLEVCPLGSTPRSRESPSVTSTMDIIWWHDCLIHRLPQHCDYDRSILHACAVGWLICHCLIISLHTVISITFSSTLNINTMEEIGALKSTWCFCQPRSMKNMPNSARTHLPDSCTLDYESHCRGRYSQVSVPNLMFIRAY